MKKIKSHRSFNGYTEFWQHNSLSTQSLMRFSTFIPDEKPVGCLIWLSGLTCTEENFIMKAGAQKYLSEHKLMVICPDTSPRGLNLPGDKDTYDFGEGAGFYVDATTPHYKNHYLMNRYVAVELIQLLQQEFSIGKDRISLFGHSMGGHGALILGLQFPELFQSISALAPIVNPTQVEWGKKAFTGYLGADEKKWQDYDACELIKKGKTHPRTILIDQGTNDEFYLQRKMLTENFIKICQQHQQPLQVNFQTGFDHSYYFVATFIEHHIKFHADFLA